MTLSDSPIAKSRWHASERVTAGVVLTIALVVGILIGVVLDRTLLAPRDRGSRSSSNPLWILQRNSTSTPNDLKRVSNRMAHDLGLTAEQAQRVDSIMNRRSGVFRAVRVETEARVKAMIDTTRAMIDSVLTPTQRVELQKIRARRQHEGPPGPPGERGQDRNGWPRGEDRGDPRGGPGGDPRNGPEGAPGAPSDAPPSTPPGAPQ